MSNTCVQCHNPNANYRFKCCNKSFCSIKCFKEEHSCAETAAAHDEIASAKPKTSESEVQASAPAPPAAAPLPPFDEAIARKLAESDQLQGVMKDPLKRDFVRKVAEAENPKEVLKELIASNPELSALADLIASESRRVIPPHERRANSG